MKNNVAKLLFTHKDANPVVLGLALLQEFGPDYLTWEPETLWQEILSTWSTTVSEVNKHRVEAVRTCHLTNTPYEYWETFEKVALAFIGIPPRFDLIQKPDPTAISIAVTYMPKVRNVQFSKEVRRYCGAVLLEFGLSIGPGKLEFCNEFMKPLVPEGTQELLLKQVKMGVKPKFDGNNDLDTQLSKYYATTAALDKYDKFFAEQVKVL